MTDATGALVNPGSERISTCDPLVMSEVFTSSTSGSFRLIPTVGAVSVQHALGSFGRFEQTESTYVNGSVAKRLIR